MPSIIQKVLGNPKTVAPAIKVSGGQDDKKRILNSSLCYNSEKKRFVNEAGAEQSVLNFEKMVLPDMN